jgi:hypothetical protein
MNGGSRVRHYGGIGRAAPRNMPRFSPRRYANGGLADLRGIAGAAPMGMPGAPPMGMPEAPPMGMPGGVEEVESINETIVEDIPAGDDEYGQRVMELKEALYSGGPEGDTVIRDFVEDFGEEALMNVIDEMSEGPVGGPGDGMSDQVPARIDGGEEVRLSSGEYVVPADAVSGLGNGSSDAGAQALMGMVDRVRGSRTGNMEQPPPIDPRGMTPV